MCNYVGKTKCELKTMICQHNHNEKSMVARHLQTYRHHMATETVKMHGEVVIGTESFSKGRLIGYTSLIPSFPMGRMLVSYEVNIICVVVLLVFHALVSYIRRLCEGKGCGSPCWDVLDVLVVVTYN